MVYYKLLLGACLLMLLVTSSSLSSARKTGDTRRLRVLHLFHAGLSLSACSYLLRLLQTQSHAQLSFFILSTCFLGTLFLWLGWREQWKRRREMPNAGFAPRDEENELVSGALPALSFAEDLPPLTARTHQVLLYARYEAYRRRERCVDTEHLLLGLLCDVNSAGMQLLNVLEASPEEIHLKLLAQMASRRTFTQKPKQRRNAVLGGQTGPMRLTQGALGVFSLAAQEAHRFDKVSVGTEHLLLGLLLMGKGRAAAVLFGEGITLDNLRREILKVKNAPDSMMRVTKEQKIR